MSKNSIEHLDFVPEDPELKYHLESMSDQGPVPEEDKPALDPVERLEQAIDEKLEGMYQDAEGVEDWDLNKVKVYMRGAFGIGYNRRAKDKGQLQANFDEWKSEAEKDF